MLSNHSFAWNNGFVNLSVIRIGRLPIGLHYLCSIDYQITECNFRGIKRLEQHYPTELSVMLKMFCVFFAKDAVINHVAYGHHNRQHSSRGADGRKVDL